MPTSLAASGSLHASLARAIVLASNQNRDRLGFSGHAGRADESISIFRPFDDLISPIRLVTRPFVGVQAMP